MIFNIQIGVTEGNVLQLHLAIEFKSIFNVNMKKEINFTHFERNNLPKKKFLHENEFTPRSKIAIQTCVHN